MDQHDASSNHMKNFSALASFSLAICSAVSAQDFVDLKFDGNLVNGQTVTVYAPASTVTMEKDIVTHLNGTVARWTNVKRYELSVVSGTQDYFCWGLCYLPQNAGALPLWISQDSVNLAPGADDPHHHAYYSPVGHVGVSSYRYVWYASANHNDSAFVDIVFDTQHVGVEENTAIDHRFDVFPNPSNSGAMSFSFDQLRGSGSEALIIYNALGERVVSRSILSAQRSVMLADGELSSGVWFAVLEVNGRPVATRRLVVTGR